MKRRSKKEKKEVTNGWEIKWTLSSHLSLGRSHFSNSNPFFLILPLSKKWIFLTIWKSIETKFFLSFSLFSFFSSFSFFFSFFELNFELISFFFFCWKEETLFIPSSHFFLSFFLSFLNRQDWKIGKRETLNDWLAVWRFLCPHSSTWIINCYFPY